MLVFYEVLVQRSVLSTPVEIVGTIQVSQVAYFHLELLEHIELESYHPIHDSTKVRGGVIYKRSILSQVGSSQSSRIWIYNLRMGILL